MDLLPDTAVQPLSTDTAGSAKLYGVPFSPLPEGLYIPPDALRVFLESFEGPLDLLLYLIRKQKCDILDISMALLTEQYMAYVELIRDSNLDLAGEYLAMAAYLVSIKSQLLLPVHRSDSDEEAEDPKAELLRRLAEYEKMKKAAEDLNGMPIEGRDFSSVNVASAEIEKTPPAPTLDLLQAAWLAVLEKCRFQSNHTVTREELSVREHMSSILRKLLLNDFLEFSALFGETPTREKALVCYLAILELAKEHMIRITQPAPFAPIWLTAQKTDSLLL